MLLFKRYHNAEAAVINLLRVLHINVNPDKVADELEKHPDYPSMLAISDVLANFKIENSAYRIDEGRLNTVPRPFLVHMNTGGGEFAVVSRIDNNIVYFSDEKKQNNRLNIADFQKVFDGIVLTAEPNTDLKQDSGYSSILHSLKIPLLIAGALLIITGMLYNNSYFSNLNWFVLTLSVLKTAGLAVSILLLVQSVDSNNPLVQAICQGGSKTDCNAILYSKAAKVFGIEWLSWSEIGFFYFAGTLLLLLSGGLTDSNILILALLNFVSLPYTFYSIYYQAGWQKSGAYCAVL